MLIGEYKHIIDDKKRLSLPTKLRSQLGKSVVITRGLDNCLFLYTGKEWQKISGKLGELGFGQANMREFNRFFLSGATEVSVDSAGRVLIPDHLREFAGTTGKVVITGVYNRLEIWDEDKWDAYKKGVIKNADQIAQKLGEIGAI